MARKKTARKTDENSQKTDSNVNEELNRKINVLTDELNALRDEKLRLLAEIQNLHKRYEREVEEARASERKKVILDIAEVLDLALTAFDTAERSQDSNLAQGIRMIRDELLKKLNNLGVVIQNPIGEKFDYRFHHALSTKETEHEDETIVEVIKRGIVYQGEVLRPSLVIVSKKSEKN